MMRSSLSLRALVVLLVAAVWLIFIDVAVVFAEGEEPAHPVCRFIPKDSLSFCSMVDYMAVVDTDDPTGTKFDSKAEFYYRNVDIVLQRFGCHAKYSVYGCDDCREAYKYWICSIKFQKCGSQAVTTDRGATKLVYSTDMCDYSSTTTTTSTTASTAKSSKTTACVEGSSGRYRTCLSICEDVVRKCPYVLNFQCPTTRRRSSQLISPPATGWIESPTQIVQVVRGQALLRTLRQNKPFCSFPVPAIA
ncbi:Stretch-activated cation channel Mid1 [Phytophthora cactorum]|nr:Stretch-activated cation channel Mid1 [Phytophthora cactorum]